MPSASATMVSQPAAWTTGKDRINDDTVYGLAIAVSIATIVLTAFVARYNYPSLDYLIGATRYHDCAACKDCNRA